MNDIMTTPQILRTWEHMWWHHVKITGERWILSSPAYNTAVYEIPDWQFRATRSVNMEIKRGMVTKDGNIPCEVENRVWLLETPTCLMEITSPIRYRRLEPDQVYDVGRWIWMDYQAYPHTIWPAGSERDFTSATIVGDVSSIMHMFSYYHLSYDWPPQISV